MLPRCRTKALARWLAILERSGFASQVGQLHAGTNHCTVRVRDACGMHRAAPDRCLGYLDDTGAKKTGGSLRASIMHVLSFIFGAGVNVVLFWVLC